MHTIFAGGGYIPLIAPHKPSGGGAHDRHNRRGDARSHRPGISGGNPDRLCRRDGSQQRDWMRDAMAAHRGRAGADRVGCKPSCWMGGRRGGACTDGGRNAYAQSHHRLFKGWKHISGHWKRHLWPQHGADHPTNYVNGRSGILCDRDSNAWGRTGAHQHAAVAGRGPLEARGISYAARKGAAV